MHRLEIKILKTLESLDRYFSANNLVLNVAKTNVLLFENRAVERMWINYQNTLIEYVENSVFLGICLDRRLDWKEHIDNLAKNISRFYYALRVIARNL
ncbi:hypothetical protein HHI36_010234, partial [Cryptolaemus montrouzieri]